MPARLKASRSTTRLHRHGHQRDELPKLSAPEPDPAILLCHRKRDPLAGKGTAHRPRYQRSLMRRGPPVGLVGVADR
jgi:hypothetical protein